MRLYLVNEEFGDSDVCSTLCGARDEAHLILADVSKSRLQEVGIWKLELNKDHVCELVNREAPLWFWGDPNRDGSTLLELWRWEQCAKKRWQIKCIKINNN